MRKHLSYEVLVETVEYRDHSLFGTLLIINVRALLQKDRPVRGK